MSNARPFWDVSTEVQLVQRDPHIHQAQLDMYAAGFTNCFIGTLPPLGTNSTGHFHKAIICYRPTFSSFFQGVNRENDDYISFSKTSVPLIGDIGAGQRRTNNVVTDFAVELKKNGF